MGSGCGEGVRSAVGCGSTGCEGSGCGAGVAAGAGVGSGSAEIVGSSEGVCVVLVLGSCSTHGIAVGVEVDGWLLAVLELLLRC